MIEPAVWTRFILAALATWRVTHLLAREDGPWDLVVRARRRLAVGFWGHLLDCFYCLSLWIAAPAASLVTLTFPDVVITWLALSGVACLLERLGEPPLMIRPAASRPEPTEKGTPHVLRTEADERERGHARHSRHH
jgi:hypothetical protein